MTECGRVSATSSNKRDSACIDEKCEDATTSAVCCTMPVFRVFATCALVSMGCLSDKARVAADCAGVVYVGKTLMNVSNNSPVLTCESGYMAMKGVKCSCT